MASPFYRTVDHSLPYKYGVFSSNMVLLSSIMVLFSSTIVLFSSILVLFSSIMVLLYMIIVLLSSFIVIGFSVNGLACSARTGPADQCVLATATYSSIAEVSAPIILYLLLYFSASHISSSLFNFLQRGFLQRG